MKIRSLLFILISFLSNTCAVKMSLNQNNIQALKADAKDKLKKIRKAYLDTINNSKDPKEIAKAKLGLANLHLVAKQYKKAVNYYEEVLSDKKNLDLETLAYAYMGMATIYHEGLGTKKNHKKAMQYYNKVINNPKAKLELKLAAKYHSSKIGKSKK